MRETGARVDRLVKQHDPAARTTHSQEKNTRPTKHHIQPGHNPNGDWNGSFIYLAPNTETRERVIISLQNTQRSVLRATTTLDRDSDHFDPSPTDPRTKNTREGRYCGPLSSFH